MSDYGYNKRDTFEKRFYEILTGCGLGWIQLHRNQGADNIVIGPYPQVAEVKNSNVYKLTAAEIKMKEYVESLGGVYWIVFDDHTALAVADAAERTIIMSSTKITQGAFMELDNIGLLNSHLARLKSVYLPMLKNAYETGGRTHYELALSRWLTGEIQQITAEDAERLREWFPLTE